MSNAEECGKRVKTCARWGQEKRSECVQTRDEAYFRCDQERDEGYRDCCDWIPCKWVCDAWTWVSHIVCVAGAWVSNIVCVVWNTIVQAVCVAWTIVTFPLCLVAAKVLKVIDGVIGAAYGVVAAVVNIIGRIVAGVLDALRHPIDFIGTVIEFFRGCPDKQGRPAEPMFVIAHHGLTSLYPENTSQSCAAAVRAGADAVEVDLCLTSDGHALLWHDYDPDDPVSLARQTGLSGASAYRPDVPPVGSSWRRPTTELTLEEFRAHFGYRPGKSKADMLIDEHKTGKRDLGIPTFAEFVADEPFSGVRLLCLDIKLPARASDFGAELVDRIHEALPLGRQFDVVVMVPSIETLKAMKGRSDEQHYGLKFTWDVEYPFGLIINPLRFSAIDHAIYKDLHNPVASVGRSIFPFPWKTYKRTLGYDITRWLTVNSDPNAYNAGVPIQYLIAWTVNDEDELKCLVKMKVSGIITDEPRRLAAVLGR